MYDYYNDTIGQMCLSIATQCKTDVGFGAVLLSQWEGEIIGTGRNRRATDGDRLLMSYVDYGIHAEQDSILAGLRKGFDVRNGSVYVLGMCLKGANKGKLTTKTEDVFICRKCPHAFIEYNINVFIPHVDGWHSISPHRALEIGIELANKGHWKNFAQGKE